MQFNEERLADAVVGVSVLEAENEAVTDQLVDSTTVECWTCGSTVKTTQIESTVERFREAMQDKLPKIREVKEELEDVKDRKSKRERQQQRRETLERTTDQIENVEETIDALIGRRDPLTAEIESLEEVIEDREEETYSEVLDCIRRLINPNTISVDSKVT